MKFNSRALQVILIAACFVAFAAADAGAVLLPGQDIGTFKVEKDGGGEVDLGYVGHPYVLCFFVAGRSEDGDELEYLRDMLKNKKFRDYEMIMITRGKDDREKTLARDFMKKRNIKGTLLFDSKSLVARRLGTLQFPSFFIVDGDGALQSIGLNSVNSTLRKRTFEEFLAMVADGKTIPFIDMIPMNEASKEANALIGKKAPDFGIPDQNGEMHSLSDYRGKNLILMYWGLDCPHCRRELPKMENFYKNNEAGYNVKILSVTRTGNDANKKRLKELIMQNMLTFPVLEDAAGKVMVDYGVKFVPAIYFINEKGVVVDFLSGEAAYFSQVYHSIFTDPMRLGS